MSKGPPKPAIKIRPTRRIGIEGAVHMLVETVGLVDGELSELEDWELVGQLTLWSKAIGELIKVSGASAEEIAAAVARMEWEAEGGSDDEEDGECPERSTS